MVRLLVNATNGGTALIALRPFLLLASTSEPGLAAWPSAQREDFNIKEGLPRFDAAGQQP